VNLLELTSAYGTLTQGINTEPTVSGAFLTGMVTFSTPLNISQSGFGSGSAAIMTWMLKM